MSLLQAIALVAVGTIAFLDRWPVLQSMMARPLVVGTAVGVTLGDPMGGALWGAVFEAMFLALLPVGASRLPDAGLAALAGTTAAVSGYADGAYPAALAGTLGWLVGHPGEWADRLQRRWNGALAARARSAAEAGRPRGPARAMAAAVGAGAVLGAVVSAAVVAGAVAAVTWTAGSPWVGPLEAGTLQVAVAAGLVVSGTRAFPSRGSSSLAWGGGALVAALLVWGLG